MACIIFCLDEEHSYKEEKKPGRGHKQAASKQTKDDPGESHEEKGLLYVLSKIWRCISRVLVCLTISSFVVTYTSLSNILCLYATVDLILNLS